MVSDGRQAADRPKQAALSPFLAVNNSELQRWHRCLTNMPPSMMDAEHCTAVYTIPNGSGSHNYNYKPAVLVVVERRKSLSLIRRWRRRVLGCPM
jgi:hypothetical protein